MSWKIFSAKERGGRSVRRSWLNTLMFHILVDKFLKKENICATTCQDFVIGLCSELTATDCISEEQVS